MKSSELVVLCNGCGNRMKFFGEWPIVFPKYDEGKEATHNVQQCWRWSCEKCTIKHPTFDHGVAMMFNVIKTPEFQVEYDN